MDKSRSYNNSRGLYKKSDKYRDRSDSRQSTFRSQSRSPARRLRVASRSPSKDNGRSFSCGHFGYFTKECPEKDTSGGKSNTGKKHKGCSHMHEGGQVEGKDEEEEQVMSAMYHSGESHSAIQLNREGKEYCKHLNQ